MIPNAGSNGSAGRRSIGPPPPLTIGCEMIHSTHNRDKEFGPPFVNSLGGLEADKEGENDLKKHCRKSAPQKSQPVT